MNNVFARFFFAAAAVAATSAISEESAAQTPAPESAETPAAESAEPAPKRAVAVRVNGEDAIYEDEISAVIDSVIAARQGQIPPDYVETARKQMRRGLMEQMALTSLLLREAEAAGMSATDADYAEFLSAVGATNVADASRITGMPVKMIDESVLVNKLVSSKTNGIAAPAEEVVRARFDEIVAAHPDATNVPERVKASHILVKVDPGASEEEVAAAKAKIDALRERALAGEDFAALARENSDCPSSARGGDLGEFGHGQMVKEFDEAAFSQEIGKVGEVVKTQFGYHVILVTDKQEAKTVGFDDVRDELTQSFVQEAARKAISDFVDSVRSSAKIEYVGDAVYSDPVSAEPTDEPPPRRLPEWAE